MTTAIAGLLLSSSLGLSACAGGHCIRTMPHLRIRNVCTRYSNGVCAAWTTDTYTENVCVEWAEEGGP